MVSKRWLTDEAICNIRRDLEQKKKKSQVENDLINALHDLDAADIQRQIAEQQRDHWRRECDKLREELELFHEGRYPYQAYAPQVDSAKHEDREINTLSAIDYALMLKQNYKFMSGLMDRVHMLEGEVDRYRLRLKAQQNTIARLRRERNEVQAKAEQFCYENQYLRK